MLTQRLVRRLPLIAFLLPIVLLLSASAVRAQTTTFTYQGRLTDSGTAANGSYDLQFTLWDSASGGTQIGATQTINTIAVSNGIFTVPLDFGANAFPGANRFLEISARLSGASSFPPPLTPRQPITSTPYAIRTLNATSADGLSSACVGCVQDSQINSVAGSKVSGAIPAASVPSGSTNYVQNTTTQQAGTTNFNISGTGTIGNLIANGNVGIGTNNLSAKLHVSGGDLLFENKWRTETTTVNPGPVPGPSNLIGGFLGTGSGGPTPGNRATTGVFGATIGGGGFNGSLAFIPGSTFTGDRSNRVTDDFGTVGGGWQNVAGNDDATLYNALFATVAGGASNTASGEISFVGGGDTNIASAQGSTVGGGIQNTASGNTATVPGGVSNVAGGEGSFAAGGGAIAAHLGTFVWADRPGPGGIQPFASTANNQFLIRAAGGVGIGTSAPLGALDVRGDVFLGLSAVPTNYSPNLNALYVANDSGDSRNHFRIDGFADDLAIIAHSGSSSAAGTSITFRTAAAGAGESNRVVINSDGTVTLNVLATAGGTSLCLNGSKIANCSSSLRYKKDVARFSGGLNIINRLRPISYTWKDRPERDLGLAAEDVAAVEPLLVTHNAKGEIEGVKYDRLTAVLVNAVKEQQEQIKGQQTEIEALKKLVCLDHPGAHACKRKD